MTKSEWQEKFLEAVADCCDEGREAADYIRARKINVGIRRARKSVGAFWTLFRSAHLNARHHTRESSLANPHAWTLLIHEVRHLQQGYLTAFSIYGELDAWQYQFQVFKKITQRPLSPLAEEILSLPLNMDRSNLQKARRLMTRHAGIWYGANFLPLYPIHKELKYWFTRKH
ncbi:hypothetical protein ANAEL_04573 [Anaerolineales bacterium]|nr:hypothetical protein ANAEL_04573 [Anaerolineales bacterium]